MREKKTNQTTKPIVFIESGQLGYLEDLTRLLLTAGYQLEVFSEKNIDFEKIGLLNPGLLLFGFESTQPNRLDFFRKLKRIPRLTDVPVLLGSDICNEQTTELAFQLDAADLICLPFRRNEVLFRIKKHFACPVSQTLETRQSAKINEATLESLLAINEYQTDSLQELLDFTLNEIIFLTGSKIGYIYFYDEQKQEFTLNTWSKEVMDECKVVEPQTIYQLEKTGIWGEVVRQRKPIMVNEFQAPNPLKKGIPEGHVALTRFLSIPVFDNNQIVAVVGVGNKETEYDQSDIRQLSLMMNSVWAVVRKRASEKKLVESEKKFRGFFEHSPVGVSITSIDGTMRFNQAFCDMLGYTANELNAIKWQDVTHPSDIEISREMIEKLLSGELDTVRFEKRFLHKNGTIVWASVTSVLERDNEGKPQYFITSITNITEKKQAEKALLASEDRFRRIVELSPIGKLLYQLNEKEELILLQANPAAGTILGIDHHSLGGKAIQEAFPQLAGTDVPDRYRRIAKGELDTQRFEIKYTRKNIDGYFEVTAFRIGENTIAVDFIDISQRKSSEEKLKESEERYRLLFESNPQPMWIYDSETLAFLDVNEAAVSKYGFSKAEFLSMGIKDIRPEKETDPLTAYLSSNINPLNRSGIWTHRKKNDELMDVEIISHQIEFQGRSARLVLSTDVTERIKAEAALLESEERFRTTLYSIGDGVVTTDAWGKVQMMNSIAEQLTGWSQDEAEGRTLEEVFQIISEETRLPVEIPVRQVLREGITVGLGNHTILVSRDGTECPIADSAAPVLDSKNEIVGAVLVFRDQTREREAERILLESEYFFRESQKAAKIGSYKFDVMTGIWTSSEVLDEIFGIEKSFLRDIEGWETLIFPEDLHMMDRHLKIEVIQEKKPFNKEYRILRKSDGVMRWVHGMGQLVFDKDGSVLFMIGTIQDITERKKAEKAIESKNRRLKAIIQAMPDLVFVSDRDGNYLEFYNPRVKDQLYPTEKVIGANIQDIFDEVTAQLHLQKIQESLDKKGLVSYEFSTLRDGKALYFEGRIVPLDENRVLRFVRDITESKKLQEEQFRLLNIIESSLNEILVFDSETLKFSYVNQGALSNLGYSLEEMKNMTPIDIKPGYDWDSFSKTLAPLIAGQNQKLIFETIHKRKDGTTYPVEIHLQLHLQDDKKMFLAFVNDITHRKLAEASLHESEDMFRRLAESSPTAICIYQDEHWVYTNPAGEKMAGYSQEEYKQMNVWEFVAPEYQSMIKQNMQMRMAGIDKEVGYDFKIVRKDGEMRWVYLRGSLISYKGRPAGLLSILDITEKKKIDEELMQSEERFRKAVTEAPFPIMLHAEGGEVLAISRGWTDMSGYEASEISTTSEWVRMAYDQEAPDIRLLFDKLFSVNHWIDEGVYQIKTKSGEHRFWDFGSSPLGKLPDGRRLVISMAKDVTDRIRTAEDVQNERTLLRTVIDNLPDAIYLKDINGRKVLANKADIENIGASVEAEVIGKSDFELYDPETAERLWNDDQKVFKQGISIINKEEIFNKGQKEQQWFLTSKVPLRNQQGDIVGLVGIGHDITSQKLATETIHKLNKGIEQNPASIVITDLNGTIEYVNPKFCEATGYTFEEAVGHNPRILKSGELSPEAYKEMWQTISTGGVWRGEFHNRRKNGELYWEQATITSIKNNYGEITHYIAIKEDISSRKMMESDLIQAKEKAEQSDKLKSAFLANMSHEIRTPLNSIIGFSELLDDEAFDVDQKHEFIRHIVENGNQLLTIISDILDISKIESGELIIRKTELPAKPFLDDIRALHLRKVEDKSLNFNFVYPAKITEVIILGDQERLHQVFNNLISNALKFTTEGYIQVGCAVRKKMLVFHVKDTGIGIAPEHHAVIFDRFRQVDASMTRKFGGNGLGLAITKNLIELMGGKIWLESEPGKGSTFFFTIPIL